MRKLFRNRSQELEDEIDAYLKAVTRAGLIYKEGMRDYLKGKEEAFEKRVQEMVQVEQEADDLLKNIKHKLYAYNLMPDASGDILELTDSLDDLVDTANHTLQHLSIEKPQFPDFVINDFEELMVLSCQAADELLKGVRSFFQNTGMVEDQVTKVYFYESETDKKEDAITRMVFQAETITRLSHKMHLRYFIQQTAAISDIAEGIGLKLSVYQLKRRL
jgi:predicted phosphate transport protein (TIGR00153 family)